MSQLSDTPEPGAPNLRRALAALPAHEPDPATWPRIEAQLAAAAALARALPALPAHEPDDDVWEAIAAQLDAAVAPAAVAPATVVRPLWRTRAGHRAWALAASLLVLLGVGWWQWHAAPAPAAPRETLTFSEEARPLLLPTPAADPLEAQGLSFIEAHCSAQPAVCQSGEFRALRTQLQELDTQQAQLQQDARRFGTSPELLREQAHLVALRASFTRQLVHLLIS
ncbi:MAG: hypothetical protein ACRYFX_15415 [Janthinobacterium lividum]